MLKRSKRDTSNAWITLLKHGLRRSRLCAAIFDGKSVLGLPSALMLLIVPQFDAGIDRRRYGQMAVGFQCLLFGLALLKQPVANMWFPYSQRSICKPITLHPEALAHVALRPLPPYLGDRCRRIGVLPVHMTQALARSIRRKRANNVEEVHPHKKAGPREERQEET